MEALVTGIHRFALDDGPGIRTTVFFKGCPLACAWCHNPECVKATREIGFERERCLGCGSCAAACAENAIGMDSAERVRRERCTLCGACVDACPSLALRSYGQAYSPAELVEVIRRDEVFFRASDGGATLSGGEPTLHFEYLEEVLRRLAEARIHTLVQTCGVFDLAAFEKRLLPYIGRIHFDLKLADAGEHARHTGVGNEVILRNFAALARVAGAKVEPRVPLVPGITDAEANLRGLEEVVRAAGYAGFTRLPYNRGGEAKRKMLGMPLNGGSSHAD